MRHAGKIILTLAVVGFLGWLWLKPASAPPTPPPSKSEPLSQVASPLTNSSPAPASPPGELLGETILQGYASANTTPEQDLTLISRLLNNYTLLMKSAADRPLSANEDWAAALTGKNPAQEKFLPLTHPALDGKGRLVDRWKNPLWFHALGQHQFEIRSAGPDGQLWTADDIHRNADGSFRRGAVLNPTSLLETSGARGGGATH